MVIYPLGKTNSKFGTYLEKSKFLALFIVRCAIRINLFPPYDNICSICLSCDACNMDKIDTNIDNFDFMYESFVLYLLAKKINKLNK